MTGNGLPSAAAGAGPVGVLGAGSWGTALAVRIASAGNAIRLWARDGALAGDLGRERANAKYLPGVALPAGVTPTAALGDLDDCDVVLAVVPSHGFRAVVRSFLRQRAADRPVVLVSATKGIETDTLARMSQVSFEEGVAADRDVRFAVLSGPTFAAEVAAGSPTAAVIASDEPHLAAALGRRFSGPTLRLYSSSDVVGVELGGAAKNVIAIGAGIVSGLGLGHNTLAALITRGLHEITRLGVACCGQPRTFSGLAGLGDLVLTCTGSLSRNRRTGVELAAGKSLEEIRRETSMVAEGIHNSLSLSRLAHQRGVEMPITEQMMALIHEGKSPRQTVEELMTRELKSEAEL